MSDYNRMSMVSGTSTPTGIRSTAQQATQVSTTTLLNALHTTYASAQPYRLDASTTLVVNTWLTAANPGFNGQQGGTVDVELARQAWEHARRRAEDACVVLGYSDFPSNTQPYFLANQHIDHYIIPRLLFFRRSYPPYHLLFHPLYIPL